MERLTIQRKIVEIFTKYKYVIIILAIGIILMLLPSSKMDAQEKSVISDDTDNILSVEEQLSQILSSVKGAGKVQVMLSIAYGEEIFYQTNDSYSADSERISDSKNTVTITGSDRNQSGLIRQVNPAVYSGAIVVCQGADNPTVRLAIMEAVSKVTGLKTDKISVLKMK